MIKVLKQKYCSLSECISTSHQPWKWGNLILSSCALKNGFLRGDSKVAWCIILRLLRSSKLEFSSRLIRTIECGDHLVPGNKDNCTGDMQKTSTKLILRVKAIPKKLRLLRQQKISARFAANMIQGETRWPQTRLERMEFSAEGRILPNSEPTIGWR